MLGLIKALGVAKTVAAVTLLTAATALGAQTALPAVASFGQSHASGGQANATTNAVHRDATSGQDESAGTDSTTGQDETAGTDATTGQDVAAIQARLAANKARLLATLESVLARLEANNVNSHAIAAIQKHIDALDATSGTTGLDRASAAVGRAHGAPDGTTGTFSAGDHPTPGNHPGRP